MKLNREEFIIALILGLAFYGAISVVTDLASFGMGYKLGAEIDSCSDLAMDTLTNLGCRWKKW